jgi:hypothetical protein
MRRLAQLICELDEVFLINTCPKTLEIARKQLEWELLAVNCVHMRAKERTCSIMEQRANVSSAKTLFCQSNNSRNNNFSDKRCGKLGKLPEVTTRAERHARKIDERQSKKA